MSLVPVHLGSAKSTTLETYPGPAFQLPPPAISIKLQEKRLLPDCRAVNFTINWDASRSSVRVLAQLEPEVAGTGHGIPMSGERLREELRYLATHFDEVMPDDGRYVRQAALADEDGVYSVPPPRFDLLPPLLLSAGILALVGTRLLRRQSVG